MKPDVARDVIKVNKHSRDPYQKKLNKKCGKYKTAKEKYAFLDGIRFGRDDWIEIEKRIHKKYK